MAFCFILYLKIIFRDMCKKNYNMTDISLES